MAEQTSVVASIQKLENQAEILSVKFHLQENGTTRGRASNVVAHQDVFLLGECFGIPNRKPECGWVLLCPGLCGYAWAEGADGISLNTTSEFAYPKMQCLFAATRHRGMTSCKSSTIKSCRIFLGQEWTRHKNMDFIHASTI